MPDNLVFRQLQTRFDTESVNHPGFSCWGVFGLEADWHQLQSLRNDTNAELMAFEEFGLPWNRRYEFWGSPTVSDLFTGLEVFRALGRQAGDRLLLVPESVLKPIDVNFSAFSDPMDRWLYFTFTLGWSTHIRELIIAKSRPFDKSLLSDPASFYSEIKNVFFASAQACGWIQKRVSLCVDDLTLMDYELKKPVRHSESAHSRATNGDALLLFLADQPKCMAALVDLPETFLNADLLTVMDADGLIEFGHRIYSMEGGVLVVRKVWHFVSVTGPNKKPMADYIKESLQSDDDERIREHVQLTAKGRVEASRLAVADKPVMELEPKSSGIENKAKKPKTRMKRSVAQPLIAEHLCRKPYDTTREISEKIGCSVGLVSESPAWKANRLRLQDAKNRNSDPIALPLTDYLSAGGSTLNSQRHAHRAAQESRDDELDAQETELFARIGKFIEANPEATNQEAAAALGCTAGDVERRQATLDQLAQEQVESAREDTEHPEWDEKEGKPKPQKWIKKQV